MSAIRARLGAVQAPGWVSSARSSRVLFVAASAPILLLGLYMWPSADDVVYFDLARTWGSPFAFATQMYAVWSGRLSTHFLNGLMFSRPELYPMLALVPPIAFVLLPLAFIASLESFDQRAGAPARWVVSGCMLAALFVGLLPYLSECVFWLTGGLGYVVPLLASVVWFGALTRQVWPNRLGPAALVLATLPVSLASEQTSAALITAAAVFACLRRRISPPFGVAVVLMIAGSIVLVAAPGNAVRAANGERGTSYAPFALLSNYGWIMATNPGRFVAPAIAGLSLGLVCALVRGGTPVNRRGVANWTLVMLAAAVSATIPLAAVPDFANSRTAFVPGAFLLASCAGGTFLLAEAFVAHVSRARTIGIGLATALVAVYLGLTRLGWNEAQVVRPQLVARWDTLARAANSNVDITVPRLAGDQPVLYFAADLSADPAYWANVSVAEFFGLRSVRTQTGPA